MKKKHDILKKEGGTLMRFYKNQHQFYIGIDLHARNMIVLKVKKSFAPSILADSTREGDTAGFIYCLIKNTREGEAIAGKINIRNLFVMWIL